MKKLSDRIIMRKNDGTQERRARLLIICHVTYPQDISSSVIIDYGPRNVNWLIQNCLFDSGFYGPQCTA
jgi:hypothetical protein